MRKRIQFLSMAVLSVAILSGCKDALLGTTTETYINQKDASQTLELSSKDTMKTLWHGGGPVGSYLLVSGDKVTEGKYAQVENTYVLKFLDKSYDRDGSKEMKLTLQPDSSLRDENGNTWQFRERTRAFRPAEAIGAHLKALHGGD